MGLMIDYIISLTHLYGLVHKDKVVEIYNMQNDEHIAARDVDDQFKDNEDEIGESSVELHGNYFVHEAIMESDEFEQELAKRHGKPFYIPNQKELLNYKDDTYFERTKEYKALKEYVQRHFFKRNAFKAEMLCDDIHLACQLGFSLENIFEPFTRRGIEFESESQVREVMGLVMNLSNNVRLWENNGFTPDELHSQTEQSTLNPLPNEPFGMSQTPTASTKQDGTPVVNNKIGRNDSCPCGSGKKYKKCCGA